MGFSRVGATFGKTYFDGILADLERALYGQLRGVIDGLAITPAAGLAIDVSAGILVFERPALLTEHLAFAVPASSDRFVWMDEAGGITLTTTAASPGGAICLGKVTTDGVGVTAITTEGRMDAPRWSLDRVYAIGQDTLVVDIENGRVGLGKGTPGHALDIDGEARLDAAVLTELVSPPVPKGDAVQVFSSASGLEALFQDTSQVLLADSAGLLASGEVERLLNRAPALKILAATGTVDAAVATTTETVLGELTLPADLLTAGDAVAIQASGRMTNTATGPTLRFRWRIGTSATALASRTILGMSPDLRPNNGTLASNNGFSMPDILLTHRSAGDCWFTGHFHGRHGDTYSGLGRPLNVAGDSLANSAVIAVATGDELILSLTAQWSAGTAGNVVSLEQLIAQHLKEAA